MNKVSICFSFDSRFPSSIIISERKVEKEEKEKKVLQGKEKPVT